MLLSVFEKILVPLDGSEHSLNALEKALQIAKKFDGKITLINVYSVSSFRLTPSQVFAYVVEIRKSGESILAEGKKIAFDKGIQVETLLKEGHIVEEILQKAREGNFDLIVMGARGISKMKEILLGSVSHGVTTHAPCPVLIVK
jgi:nucleotide-binding universal stress UspA family protein